LFVLRPVGSVRFMDC